MVSELPLESYVVQGVNTEAVDALDVMGGQD